MNALALDILRTDARLADTRHTLKVIEAQKEARQNPPRWEIGAYTSQGVIGHHFLDSGAWWYRVDNIFTDDTRFISEVELLEVIRQNASIWLQKPQKRDSEAYYMVSIPEWKFCAEIGCWRVKYVSWDIRWDKRKTGASTPA